MKRYHDFTLIDLYSQRKAVNRYVRGWSRDAVLSWLTQYGVVTEHPFHRDVPWKQYIFSPFGQYGFTCVFNFDGDPLSAARHGIVVIMC
ncbi:MAG: hypothetical protein ABI690_12465 [Chloroflexota bacterium]